VVEEDGGVLLFVFDVVVVVLLWPSPTVVREETGCRVVVEVLRIAGRAVVAVVGGEYPVVPFDDGAGRKRMYRARVPMKIATMTSVEGRARRWRVTIETRRSESSGRFPRQMSTR
jgi:hypothetical protein